MNLDDLLPDRTDALHTLGHVLPDAFDAEAALQYGGLKGWNLKKAALVADSLAIPDKFAVIRNRGGGLIDSLGIVGPAAKVSQNEDLVPLLERLISETGGHFDTAGSFDDGRKVFVSMILPGRRDEIEDHLTVIDSHDATYSPSVMVTPIHRRTKSLLAFPGNLFRADSADLVSKVYDYLDELKELERQMKDTDLPPGTLETVIEREYGPRDDDAKVVHTRRENQVTEIVSLLGGETPWDGLLALLEWQDHLSPVRPAGRVVEAKQRARRALLDTKVKGEHLDRMKGLI